MKKREHGLRIRRKGKDLWQKSLILDYIQEELKEGGRKRKNSFLGRGRRIL